MNNVQSYLKPENIDKQYLIKLKSGDVVVAYIEDVVYGGVSSLYFTYYRDYECYSTDEIEEVLKELPDDFTLDCDSCDNGNLDVDKALDGETTYDDCLNKQEHLIKFKTKQPNVYKYNSIEELEQLYEVLGSPIPNNLDKDWDTEKLIIHSLKHSSGLVYTWSHWDDFQDNPFDYCAVIDGGILSD